MKKINLLITLCLILTISVSAQKTKEIKGEESYEVYSYQECIDKFEGLSEKTIDIKR